MRRHRWAIVGGALFVAWLVDQIQWRLSTIKYRRSAERQAWDQLIGGGFE